VKLVEKKERKIVKTHMLGTTMTAGGNTWPLRSTSKYTHRRIELVLHRKTRMENNKHPAHFPFWLKGELKKGKMTERNGRR
jgi:hypothetical protein